MDRAAVRAEAETLRTLGEQTKILLKRDGLARMPRSTTEWCSRISVLADLSQQDVTANRRLVDRVYIFDPYTTSTTTQVDRVIILSLMRDYSSFPSPLRSIRLPITSEINSRQRFDEIWETADGFTPAGSHWSGWGAFRAVSGARGEYEYLLIERVNLRPIYETDLRQLPIALVNRGSRTVHWEVVRPDGSRKGSPITLPPGRAYPETIFPRERLNLYDDGGALNYTYVAGLASGVLSFEFNGTDWIPK